MNNISEATIQSTVKQLLDKFGADQQSRIETGVKQVASFWQERDGDPEAFTQFCEGHFIKDEDELIKTADRFEKNLESLNGHFLEIIRDLSEPMHLDVGPMLAVDYQFAEYSPLIHLHEDLFQTKIAFTALLNYPLHDLKDRLKLGPKWSRAEWARTRLVENFSFRVPTKVNEALNQVYVRGWAYISDYNIFMHNVVTENGKRLFAKDLKLHSHWGLRDELRGLYADPEGLPKQELIYQVMQKIINQDIPQDVINNPDMDWNITEESTSPEPDKRYQIFLDIFKAEQLADPYYPTMPTKMDRCFQKDREIPEEKVEELLVSLLTSDAFVQTGKLIEKRLGRKLKPFDIWYNGFKSRGSIQESDLDKQVQKKYQNITAFEKDIPRILEKLGFSKEAARLIASKIKVDPARGSGHAIAAERRADNAHLRTRVPEGGMNYQGYNTACHELGHNVEQVISLNLIDHTLLRSVPNTAFTEAFAFMFQDRDLELLGIKSKDKDAHYLKALDRFWSTCEIAGSSLVDMKVWRWMYNNPKATAAELKIAVIDIAKQVWNKYFAPVFGQEDVILFAVYSHMICGGMYLPDYPLGLIIAHQIESYMKDKNLGTEMTRMCKLGSITPDAWMLQAVGKPISTQSMLEDAKMALNAIDTK